MSNILRSDNWIIVLGWINFIETESRPSLGTFKTQCNAQMGHLFIKYGLKCNLLI